MLIHLTKVMKTIILLLLLCSCSQRIYTDSLQDQRKKHTQKITSKDIAEGRIAIFVCIGIIIYIDATFSKEN